jgi:protocatechuate 3,4-dioxygenase beta subunit
MGLTLVLTRGAAADELAKTPSTPQISARGRVLTADGQPSPGSRVVLRASSTPAIVGLINFQDVLAETTSDMQGRFVFDRVNVPATMNGTIEDLHRGQRGADIVVIEKGFAISWAPLYSFDDAYEITLKLEPPVAFTGVVTDAEDRPLSDAEVSVLGISHSEGPIDVSLEGRNSLRLYASSLRPKTITNANGKFRFAQFPTNCHVQLEVVHPDHQRKFLIAATGEEAHARTLRDAGLALLPEIKLEVQANPVAVKLESGLRLHVHVLSDDTNKSLPTGRIVLMKESQEWKTTVRPDGTAAITVADPGEYILMFVPADGYDHLIMQQKLTMSANTSVPTQVELRVPSPRWLAGRVVERGTDTGVGGVTVNWSLRQGNSNDSDATFYSQTVTRPDGGFRLPIVPGPGNVLVSGEVAGFVIPSYDTMPYEEAKTLAIPVDIPADSESPPLRIEVSRGLIVQGSVRDVHGNVMPDAIVRAASLGRYGPRFCQTIANAAGQFELAGLNPREAYQLSVSTPAGIARQSIRGNEAHSFDQNREVSVDLRMEPVVLLRGRVVMNEKPLANVRVELMFEQRVGDEIVSFPVIATAVTGNDGRYALGGLRAGDYYLIAFHPPIPAVEPNSFDTHQVAADAKREIALPDVRLFRPTQTLAGIVVDPDGKPVAGVTVSAQLKNGSSLSRSGSNPPPWTETGADGTFRITHLPEQSLQLMAYIRSKGDDQGIRYPARVECSLNQQDIRILLDPSLVRDE